MSCVKIMCMGDSITKGGNGGYRVYLKDSLVKVGVDFEYVGAQEDECGRHEGYPGFGIGHLLHGNVNETYGTSQEISVALNEYKPDVLLLMVGTNDMYFANPTEAFSTLKTLVDKAMETLPGLTIQVASILPVRPGLKPWGSTIPEDVITRIPEFNGMIAGYVTALKEAGKKINFVDIYRTVGSVDELGPDGVHPEAPVFKIIADKWFAALDS